MFNFIDIYSFISVSFCVGMDLSALLFPGVYNAIQTALITWCNLQIESDILNETGSVKTAQQPHAGTLKISDNGANALTTVFQRRDNGVEW